MRGVKQSQLFSLQNKRTKLIVDLMPGTSADGIDAVLVRVSGGGVDTRLIQLAFGTYPYPAGLRNLILQNSLPGTGSVDLPCELNILVAHFFADAWIPQFSERFSPGVRASPQLCT
jgi:anhydro-N-acetylmuramic acid kinase